jgi:hypothetical protein
MADITVQVSSAGLTAYGSQSWGSFSYGGDNQPSVTVQTGTEAYPEQGWGGKQWGVKLWGNLTDDAAEINRSSTFNINRKVKLNTEGKCQLIQDGVD